MTEGMKTIEDLPEDVGITIEKDGVIWEIYYSLRDDPSVEADDPRGAVGMEPVSEMFDCAIKDAFHLRSSADHGWGPLLYDVAMEWATMKGSGLMSDRAGLSPHSKAVWQYYYDNREDVKVRQLDDLKNTLTPQDDRDNCKQAYGVTNSWYDLENSATAKLFTKQNFQITRLHRSGRLTIIE